MSQKLYIFDLFLNFRSISEKMFFFNEDYLILIRNVAHISPWSRLKERILRIRQVLQKHIISFLVSIFFTYPPKIAGVSKDRRRKSSFYKFQNYSKLFRIWNNNAIMIWKICKLAYLDHYVGANPALE